MTSKMKSISLHSIDRNYDDWERASNLSLELKNPVTKVREIRLGSIEFDCNRTQQTIEKDWNDNIHYSEGIRIDTGESSQEVEGRVMFNNQIIIKQFDKTGSYSFNLDIILTVPAWLTEITTANDDGIVSTILNVPHGLEDYQAFYRKHPTAPSITSVAMSTISDVHFESELDVGEFTTTTFKYKNDLEKFYANIDHDGFMHMEAIQPTELCMLLTFIADRADNALNTYRFEYKNGKFSCNVHGGVSKHSNGVSTNPRLIFRTEPNSNGAYTSLGSIMGFTNGQTFRGKTAQAGLPPFFHNNIPPGFYDASTLANEVSSCYNWGWFDGGGGDVVVTQFRFRDSGGVKHTISVMAGKYKPHELAHALQVQFNELDVNIDIMYSVTYEEERFTISCSRTSGYPVDFALLFSQSNGLIIERTLGFDGIDYTGRASYTGRSIIIPSHRNTLSQGIGPSRAFPHAFDDLQYTSHIQKILGTVPNTKCYSPTLKSLPAMVELASEGSSQDMTPTQHINTQCNVNRYLDIGAGYLRFELSTPLIVPTSQCFIYLDVDFGASNKIMIQPLLQYSTNDIESFDSQGNPITVVDHSDPTYVSIIPSTLSIDQDSGLSQPVQFDAEGAITTPIALITGETFIVPASFIPNKVYFEKDDNGTLFIVLYIQKPDDFATSCGNTCSMLFSVTSHQHISLLSADGLLRIQHADGIALNRHKVNIHSIEKIDDYILVTLYMYNPSIEVGTKVYLDVTYTSNSNDKEMANVSSLPYDYSQINTVVEIEGNVIVKILTKKVGNYNHFNEQCILKKIMNDNIYTISKYTDTSITNASSTGSPLGYQVGDIVRFHSMQMLLQPMTGVLFTVKYNSTTKVITRVTTTEDVSHLTLGTCFYVSVDNDVRGIVRLKDKAAFEVVPRVEDQSSSTEQAVVGRVCMGPYTQNAIVISTTENGTSMNVRTSHMLSPPEFLDMNLDSLRPTDPPRFEILVDGIENSICKTLGYGRRNMYGSAIYTAPCQWQFGPVPYVLIRFLSSGTTDLNLAEYANGTMTDILAKVNTGASTSQVSQPIVHIGTGKQSFRNIRLQILNPDLTEYHFHGTEYSITLCFVYDTGISRKSCF